MGILGGRLDRNDMHLSQNEASNRFVLGQGLAAS